MLLNFLHKLDTADRHCRAFEPFESEHRSDPLLDAPMILLDRTRTRFGKRPSEFN
jgi:hypothetical protein